MSFIRFTYLLFLFAAPSYSSEESEHEDFYTSISGMESLLDLEYHLLDNLKDYVNRELAKHQQINLLLDEFENENEEALNNPEKYFSSPINVFKLIKRSVVDFKDLESFILERSNEEEYAMNVTRIETDLQLPVAKEDDLKGASLGLARLQKTYKLNASDLADGRIFGVKYSPAMSASDSYHLGKQLYDAENYGGAFEWFSETRQRLNFQNPDDWDFIGEVKLLEQFGAAAYGSGKLQIAKNIMNDLLLIDPGSEYASENLKTVEMDIFVERNSPKKRQLEQKVKPDVSEMYEATCRGEWQQTPFDERPLRCSYVSNNVPFLTIAPFKMEQLSLDPLMVYYHDAIYENEIAQVLKKAAPHIYRSRVGNSKESLVSAGRTSKNTWLEYGEHDFLGNIEQRLEDMTQLSLETAEPLQVANYGIGGHYGPHYDFSPVPDIAYGAERGNRIATALFYISDVELGGATAFPLLKLAVKPIRRSLVFWYNLLNSTDPDYRMTHAGCPVLKGSKWILNEWIHERGQEFMRPCGLELTPHFSEYLYRYRNVQELYEATCRGELRRSPSEERLLRCMYVNNNVPFLKIAPFKMEQLSFDPLMVLYHDVIYENEIDQILETTAPHIYRSRVGDSNESQVSPIRTSKNAWLDFDDHEFLKNIQQRLLDMTQMSLETAEDLQVANYGIGGHYGPHYDFHPIPDVAYGAWMGNRIATALFYISDVELGGATAFPYLKLAVKPVRRSLVFWHNLHNSTDPDYRTVHAGCPVLKGSKWILNEWLHERGQEFMRPCGLQLTANLSAEYHSNFYDLYEATCRGELQQTPSEQRPLSCMYVNNNVPFLRIAPFKMEQLSLDPLMVYYHDAIYDNEIKKLIETVAPNIFRSRVYNDFNESEVTTDRTSKNTWINFYEYNFLDNVKQRLVDMTQMSLDTAGRLQVANYGIGGHYAPHFDFHPFPNRAYGEWRGNRIASALFYISDVELGGATAFPFLKLAVKPIRRSLVYWYNLHSSSEPDYRTMHAGCPVIKGSKWILNQWIHERGQEFIRPCGLQSEADLLTEYI